jgi:hypothetical protein
MMRVAMVALLLFSVASAHQGFNQLSWQEKVGAYTLTVLEDFHVTTSGEGLAQLIVQVSEGQAAAPAGTEVKLTLGMAEQTVYQGPVPLVANSSSDGKTFYASYVFRQALEQAGWYDLRLELSGPLGSIERSYLVQSQQGSRITWLAYLPTLLILLICAGGVVLLFAPLPSLLRKDSYGKAD